jgi:hypothetical protein
MLSTIIAACPQFESRLRKPSALGNPASDSGHFVIFSGPLQLLTPFSAIIWYADMIVAPPLWPSRTTLSTSPRLRR